jgi:hypothetical protein
MTHGNKPGKHMTAGQCCFKADEVHQIMVTAHAYILNIFNAFLHSSYSGTQIPKIREY